MKYSSIISSIAALVSSTIVVILDEWFSSFINNRAFCLTAAIIIASIIAIAFQAFFNYLPRTIKRIRWLTYPMSKFEGMWIQIHESTHDVALCKVEYNTEKDEFAFSGEHYTNSGFVVRFTSNGLHYDESIFGFDYLVQGQHDSGEFVKCWGYVSFSYIPGVDRNYNTGHGAYVEIGSSLNLTKFSLIRPTPELLAKLKNSVPSNYNTILHEFINESA